MSYLVHTSKTMIPRIEIVRGERIDVMIVGELASRRAEAKVVTRREGVRKADAWSPASRASCKWRRKR